MAIAIVVPQLTARKSKRAPQDATQVQQVPAPNQTPPQQSPQSQSQAQPPPQAQQPSQAPPQPPRAAPPQPGAQAGAPQAITPSIAVAPPTTGPTIVLNPAHGGTDTGARGQNGGVEKDIVLQLARDVRAALARQGYRVVMTRDDDSNPSYDDRAALVNGYRDAILISLHVSSTGMGGTARAYYSQFPTSAPPAMAAPATGDATASNSAGPRVVSNVGNASGLVSWTEAQKGYAPASHRLADVIQGELAQVFSGSPVSAASVPVRELRSVEAPAVAIEISSVAALTPAMLVQDGAPLSNAIVQGIIAFRPANSAGAK
jgi:N-acetylmuramoyl-L-alanine amidase